MDYPWSTCLNNFCHSRDFREFKPFVKQRVNILRHAIRDICLAYGKLCALDDDVVAPTPTQA
jgi:hypothetical protein